MPTFIRPRGSADAIAVNAIAPETAGLNSIDVYTKNIAGTVYAQFEGSSSIFRCNNLAQYSAAAMVIGPKVSQDLHFRTNDTIRWIVDDADGHFKSNSAGNLDVGESAARVRTAYVTTLDVSTAIATLPQADFTNTPYGGTESMTFSGTSTPHRRTVAIGKLAHVQIRVTGTIGGTPSYGVTFTLPTTAAALSGGQVVGPIWIQIADGTYEHGYGEIASGGTTCVMRRPGIPPKAYDAGTTFFYANFWYETA